MTTSTHVYIGTSLDGFIARPDGDFAWLSKFADDEAIAAYNEFMAGIDVIVIGRGTFETVLAFPAWPYDKPVFVLSSSIKEVPERLLDKASILSLKPEQMLSHLGEMGFANAYIDGGKVIQSFLAGDLIDELIISKVPVLIGSGIPLFGFLDGDIHYNHVRTTICSNGLIRSYYNKQPI